MTKGAQSNHFVHTLLRARDWQHRPEFDQVCDWWRTGGRGVCALVGMGGAGKTAIAERFLRVLPHVTEPEPQLAKDNSLRTPNRLFVFSFYKDNEDRFFGELCAWLKSEPYDDSARPPSFHQTLDLLKSAPCLLVLDGLEKVQDDGARGGVFGQITDGRLSDLVQRVASGLVPGVAAMITTRFPIAELEEQRPPHFRPINVEEISDSAGVSLLTTRGVHGTKTELQRIVQDCGNHALTVDLAGGYIVEFGHGAPETPLKLETTPKQESEINAEPNPQRRYVMRQEHRFARVAERYREGFAEGDPASLALLERVCLFRQGVDAATLTSIFTGKDKEEISGKHLAHLSQTQLEQKLRLLTEMRLLETSDSSQPSTASSQQSIRHTIHPAVRDGFLGGIGREAATASHEAVRKGLEVSLGDAPGANPSDSATLNLLEEILHHTLQSGHVPEAWDIYCDRIGGYKNLLWRLGAYERGERICRAFAGGATPKHVADFTNARDRDPDDRNLVDPASRVELPYLALSESAQALLINDWALYLQELGRLASAAGCRQITLEINTAKERWKWCSIDNQNLCGLYLRAGRLTGSAGSLPTADEALRLAERAADEREQCDSYAYRAQARALRGEVPAALTDLNATLGLMDKLDLLTSDRTIYSLPGIWHSHLLARLGRHEEAKRLTEANKKIELEIAGPDNIFEPQCNLILSDMPGETLDLAARMSLSRLARDWAVARDAQRILCWSALVQTRIELSAISGQESAKEDDRAERLTAADTSIAEGLKIARDCGYGIFHIDLLLERTRLGLLRGEPRASLEDLRLALDEGIPANEETGQPELLAANHEDCGYAWAIPFGLQLRAEAQLLQAAQQLGADFFAPAKQKELPGKVKSLIDDAKKNLEAAMDLWQPLHDPEPERPDQNFKHPKTDEEYNYRATETWQILQDLAGGVLTRYPLAPPMPHVEPALNSDLTAQIRALKEREDDYRLRHGHWVSAVNRCTAFSNAWEHTRDLSPDPYYTEKTGDEWHWPDGVDVLDVEFYEWAAEKILHLCDEIVQDDWGKHLEHLPPGPTEKQIAVEILKIGISCSTNRDQRRSEISSVLRKLEWGTRKFQAVRLWLASTTSQKSIMNELLSADGPLPVEPVAEPQEQVHESSDVPDLEDQPTHAQPQESLTAPKRFRIALSFPGEHRSFVLDVAEALADKLTRDRVFYDEWYEVELLGVGGDLKLQAMYEQADLIVPFFSEHYSKPWCSMEWETIRGILLNRRKDDAVIPVHLDDTDVPGWPPVNFGIRLRARPAQEIADLILQALALRNPKAATAEATTSPSEGSASAH